MKAAYYEEHGDTDRILVGERPDPSLEPGQVLVKVHACALNGFDPMMLVGSTGLNVPKPMIPCGDFAGEVVEVSLSSDSDWKVGDRVSGYPILPKLGMMGEVTSGAACDLVSMPPDCLIKIPDGVSFEQAAALPVAYGTALRMVQTRGKISQGERVLVLGATGGVGVASIQLAKAAGAYVVACGRGDKAKRLIDVGADDVINTAECDFFTEARSRYGKPSYTGDSDGGFDVVVNYIGGETWVPGLKLLRKHGRVLVCGATAGYQPPTDLRYIWSFEQTVVGSNGWTMDDQATLLNMVASGELNPIIDSVVPLEGLADSMQRLIQRDVLGKAVISL